LYGQKKRIEKGSEGLLQYLPKVKVWKKEEFDPSGVMNL
jgi:hypothetical protein